MPYCLDCTPATPAVMAGDLAEAAASVSHGARVPSSWLAIDPHGFVGHRGYEVCAILGNLPPKSCEGKDRGKVQAQRADILVGSLI